MILSRMSLIQRIQPPHRGFIFSPDGVKQGFSHIHHINHRHRKRLNLSGMIGNRFSGDWGTRPRRSFWRAVTWQMVQWKTGFLSRLGDFLSGACTGRDSRPPAGRRASAPAPPKGFRRTRAARDDAACPGSPSRRPVAGFRRHGRLKQVSDPFHSFTTSLIQKRCRATALQNDRAPCAGRFGLSLRSTPLRGARQAPLNAVLGS